MPADLDLGRGECPQVWTRVVVWITAGILVALVTVAFGLQLLFPDRIGITFVVRHRLPAPGVTSDERAERLALEANQKLLLNGAGGRMPIETAMQAVAAKGAHGFDPIGPGQ